MLLGLDIGTTHIKAGLFALDGNVLGLSYCQNEHHRGADGVIYYSPNELWQATKNVITNVLCQKAVSDEKVTAIGVSSMAESGLLIDRLSGVERTPIYVWFDRSNEKYVDVIKQAISLEEGFLRSGIRPTYKCALTRLLWLKDRNPEILKGAVWLSTADYIVNKLTGAVATDYTLAGRTYVFDIGKLEWQTDLLNDLGLNPELWPEVYTPGEVISHSHGALFGSRNIPVTIAGHDHICAAYSASAQAGVFSQQVLFNSIGTAESLVGATQKRCLQIEDYSSGFSFGLHTVPGFLYWVGGLSASGGSLEWLRNLLGDPALSYEELRVLLPDATRSVGELFYFPYLGGSGSPHSNQSVRGAIIGLQNRHGRADIYQAVLEGTAYEMEYIRRQAEQTTGENYRRIVVAGGGVRNSRWMQIKADIYGIPIEVMSQPEATCLGAALLAGFGCGAYKDITALLESVAPVPGQIYYPDEQLHRQYKDRFEIYLAFQAQLRKLDL